MSLIKEAKRLLAAWEEATPGTYGAAVAYYSIFSLAPLLIIAIAIAGIAFNSSTVQESVLTQFSSTFGDSGATFIRSLISSKSAVSKNIVSAVIGSVLVLIGATGIFGALQSGLDAIFKTLPIKKAKGVWKTLLQKLLSIGMVFSLGFILLASLTISTALVALSAFLSSYLPGIDLLLMAVNFVVSYALIALFLSGMFIFLPSERVPFKPALIGGCIAAAFFMLGKYILGLYFTLTSAGNAFGVASALVLIILWSFYLSQVLFLSAIILRLYLVSSKKRCT